VLSEPFARDPVEVFRTNMVFLHLITAHADRHACCRAWPALAL